MTHWRSLMDRDYLGAWDVPTDKVVEIVKVDGTKLPGTGEIKANKKPVLTLRNTEKRFIVNATIGKTIAALYGNDVEAWIGKRIVLYATTCRSKGGETVDCVRVRNIVPQSKATGVLSQPVNQEMRAKQIAAADTSREPGEEG